MRTRWHIVLIAAAMLLAVGCAVLPRLSPDYVAPETVTPALVAPSRQPEPAPDGARLAALGTEERAMYEVYRAVNRGVVNITSISARYNWFLQLVPQEGTGSGSIIDRDGVVLTNHHVVKGAARLFVTLHDGTSFEARVVGVDPENDLAVIRFDPRGVELTVVPFGSSGSLVVGQKLIALGNPFGLERTLTAGVVSSLRRPLQTPEGFILREMIQTDAAINPGNSGGPLLDLGGAMVGINTMIVSPAGGSIGIGFAVPVDTARRVVADILSYGSVRRGWIDIDPVPLFPALAQRAGLAVNRGILVSRVARGGNAENAGLRGGDPGRRVNTGGRIVYLGGDVITAIDGLPVWTLMDLLGALEATKPGQTASVEVLRDTTRLQLRVELSERPRTMGL